MISKRNEGSRKCSIRKNLLLLFEWALLFGSQGVGAHRGFPALSRCPLLFYNIGLSLFFYNIERKGPLLQKGAAGRANKKYKPISE